MTKLLIVILAHDDRECLEDMVDNVRFYCPHATIGLYNSGDDPDLGKDLPVTIIQPSRRLYYARIAPFFFDLFEWLSMQDFPYEYVTNLDSDVLFIRHGYEDFIDASMKSYDYMAPDLRFNAHRRSQWRPMRSLKPEIKRWYKFLGFKYMHGAFNPGQTFSKKYIESLVNHPSYQELLNLVSENQSFTLHEVLFPTLVDFLGLRARSYPEELNPIIRYRPYQAISGVKRAIGLETAFFIHPIKRDMDNPARVFIQKKMRQEINWDRGW